MSAGTAYAVVFTTIDGGQAPAAALSRPIADPPALWLAHVCPSTVRQATLYGMVRTITGKLVAQGKRFGVVVGRFNELVTTRLLEGALDSLERHGAASGDVTVVWVPGAFEIPLAAQRLAQSGSVDAVVCLGCVIRGETPHFDHVAGACSSGVASAAIATGIPVIFGVLTTDTLEQALARAGSKAGNKGADAASAAIEMVSVLSEIGK